MNKNIEIDIDRLNDIQVFMDLPENFLNSLSKKEFDQLKKDYRYRLSLSILDKLIEKDLIKFDVKSQISHPSIRITASLSVIK